MDAQEFAQMFGTGHYEEKEIDGVLCHRNSVNGKWIPFSIEALTIAFVAVRGALESEYERRKKLELKLSKIKSAVAESG